VEPDYFHDGCFIEFEVVVGDEVSGTAIMEVEKVILGDPRPVGHRGTGQLLEPEYMVAHNRGCSTVELEREWVAGWPSRFAIHLCGEPKAEEMRRALKSGGPRSTRCRGTHPERATLHASRIRLLEGPIEEDSFEPDGLPGYKKVKGRNAEDGRRGGDALGAEGLGRGGSLAVVARAGGGRSDFSRRLADSLDRGLPPAPPRGTTSRPEWRRRRRGARARWASRSFECCSTA
jgi:hypothetical protein